MPGEYTIRTRKFMSNPLLCRKQFVVEVVHPGIITPRKKEIIEKLATLYKVKDSRNISVFGLKPQFGGGRTTGFGLLYDNIEALKKFEPAHRLRKLELVKAKGLTRRAKKELKLKIKKSRGKKRGELTAKLRK